MTIYFNRGTTGTSFGNPTGSGLCFNTSKVPLNWPLIYRELNQAQFYTVPQTYLRATGAAT